MKSMHGIHSFVSVVARMQSTKGEQKIERERELTFSKLIQQLRVIESESERTDKLMPHSNSANISVTVWTCNDEHTNELNRFLN